MKSSGGHPWEKRKQPLKLSLHIYLNLFFSFVVLLGNFVKIITITSSSFA